MPASRRARTVAGAAAIVVAVVLAGFAALPAAAAPRQALAVQADPTPTDVSPSPDPVTATVSGRVLLGAAGTAPAGAGQVRVTPASGVSLTNRGTPIPAKAVVTDATGSFSIAGLPIGTTYALTYQWLGAVGEYQSLVQGRSFHLTTSADFTVPTVDIPRLVSISGHVYLGDATHSAGAGQVQARVMGSSCIPACPAPTTTDANGAYTITGVPEGSRQVEFIFLPDAQYLIQDSSPVVVTTDVTGLDATLEHSPTISGRVTDSGGAPLAGATVDVDGHDPADASHMDHRQVTTDASGGYLVPGLTAGYVYTVSFWATGYLSADWPNAGALLPAGTLTLGSNEVRPDVDATLYRPATASGVLSGVGVSVYSLAAGGTSVDALIQDPATHTWLRESREYGVGLDGTWAVYALPPGTYRFQAAYYGPFGQSTVASPRITLAEGGHATYSARLRGYKRDFSGDFLPDILVRNATGQLWEYPANESGGFLAKHQVGNGWGGMTAIFNAGGFENPYDDDIIARDSQGILWLYAGTESGHFVPTRRQIGNGWNSMNVIFSPGDFNGDGHPDVMARDAHGYLWLYRGTGNGRFGGTVRVGTGWSAFTSIFAAGDMNEDGFPDVLARDASGGLWLYPGNGSGGWKPRVKVGTGWSPFTALVSVGDFNGDHAPDVIARDPAGYLWLYPGNGDGTLGARTRIGNGWNGLTFVN